MPNGLVGVEQVLLYIMFYGAEQLLAAAEDDQGRLLVVEYAQYDAQQEQQKCKHRTDVDMQRERATMGVRSIAHEQLLRR